MQYATLEGIALKNQAGGRPIVYVHVNQPDQYVMSYGIEFPEFMKGIPIQPPNLLLLRHKFEDSSFNLHTLIDYVDPEQMEKLARDAVYGYGDFCWIDFEDEESLNQLDGQELAELLYLGHFKDHLQLPFYRKLGNRYVYLAHDDGWFNKTYYRSLGDFKSMLGRILSLKASDLKKEKSFFSRWKGKELPPIPPEAFSPFMRGMKEGLVFSLEKTVKNRLQVEIPIWIIGDFYDMDEMVDEYEMLGKRPIDGKLVYDRKSGLWEAQLQ